MHRKFLAAAAALALTTGVATWTAHAEPGDDDAPPPPPPPAEHGPGMDWMHRMPPGMFGHHHRVDALVAPVEDRKLTGAEVQKVAEAYLLWNGNRSWKVANVTEEAGNMIGFSYVTQKGDEIARFKIDRKTGRIERAQ